MIYRIGSYRGIDIYKRNRCFYLEAAYHFTLPDGRPFGVDTLARVIRFVDMNVARA